MSPREDDCWEDEDGEDWWETEYDDEEDKDWWEIEYDEGDELDE